MVSRLGMAKVQGKQLNSERHVMDLVEEAIEKSAQFEDDGFHLGKALMFYGLVLEKSDNDYCYVVIHND